MIRIDIAAHRRRRTPEVLEIIHEGGDQGEDSVRVLTGDGVSPVDISDRTAPHS